MENNNRLQLEIEAEYLEWYIAVTEKSIFNPMYYFDYPHFESVQASKLELENIKLTLRMINEQ